jgi:hypothetical protein
MVMVGELGSYFAVDALFATTGTPFTIDFSASFVLQED